jgi:biotin synthase
MSKNDILHAARRGAHFGAKRVGIVTSGKAPDGHEVERIASAIRGFPSEGLEPCASLGEISLEFLKVLKDSGLKRYHHNIETAERFYPKIVSTHTYADRIRTIAKVKDAGMEVCSGGIFGLGETWKDRVDMALSLKQIEVDSVPINFLMPIEGTPMAFHPVISVSEALRIIAIFRIILEKPVIKVAAGREMVFKDLQKLIFSAGADGMMVGGYLTVPGTDPYCDRSLIMETVETWKEQLKISV